MFAIPDMPGLKIPDYTKYILIGIVFFLGTLYLSESAWGWQSLLEKTCQDATCVYFNTTKMHGDRTLAMFCFMISLSFFIYATFERIKTKAG